MRNLAKESVTRAVKMIAPLPAPTPAQHLGYRKAHLSQLMRAAGELNTRASLRILKMDAAEVDKQIGMYENQEQAQIQSLKDELRGKVQIAYDLGFLPKVEWVNVDTWINNLQADQVQSQTDYYTRLIASKETSKAA